MRANGKMGNSMVTVSLRILRGIREQVYGLTEKGQAGLMSKNL